MSRHHRLLSVAVLGTTAALVLAACGGQSDAGGSSTAAPTTATTTAAATSSSVASSASGMSSASAAGPSATGSAPSSGTAAGIAGCTPTDLKTKKAGTLTIATDDPAYDPWFSDNDPTNGKGFESAVAYAVADRLGYAKDEVTWTRAKFNAAISPAPKDFDFDINQFSISEDRKKAVDFSTGYYDVTQVVVTTKDSPIAGAKSIADLKNAKLGAQIGTTSLTALKNQIATAGNPAVFQTNDLAVKALQNKQIDGIVADLPTGFYMTAAQLDNGLIVGQLPVVGAPEQFGLLLEKGSPLTDCASKAVDSLRADGTLDKLRQTWLTAAGAPELK